MSEKEFIKELNSLLAKAGGKASWTPDSCGAPIYWADLKLDGKKYILQLQEETEGE